MEQVPLSIVVVIAVLTIFLCFVLGIRYGVRDEFLRTRLIMTAFFLFIVTTLTASFWGYALDTLPFTAPACTVGILVGYILGVRAARERVEAEGVRLYRAHFAHLHIGSVASLNWWTFINFYTVMSGLIMINLIGLSNVIFDGNEQWAIATSVVGAFLIGTIIPYLWHIWSIRSKSIDR